MKSASDSPRVAIWRFSTPQPVFKHLEVLFDHPACAVVVDDPLDVPRGLHWFGPDEHPLNWLLVWRWLEIMDRLKRKRFSLSFLSGALALQSDASCSHVKFSKARLAQDAAWQPRPRSPRDVRPTQQPLLRVPTIVAVHTIGV